MEGYRKKHTGLWRIPLKETEDQTIINTIKNVGNHNTVNEIVSEDMMEEVVKSPHKSMFRSTP